jgi:hypothetical protein
MREKYRISSPADAVFIHVRRGDYVPFTHLYGGVGEKYYTDAMKEYMSENLYGKRFLVISDDPEWCRGQPWLNSYEIVAEPDELDSLVLMASCKGGAIIFQGLVVYSIHPSGFPRPGLIYSLQNGCAWGFESL